MREQTSLFPKPTPFQASAIVFALLAAGGSTVASSVASPSRADIQQTVRETVKEELAEFGDNLQRIETQRHQNLELRFRELERRIETVERVKETNK